MWLLPQTVCDLSPTTPRRMLFAELGLLPLQMLWWRRQTLQFWNSLAALPTGSSDHTVCLDNLDDAFWGGHIQYGQLCGKLLAFSGL